MSNSPAESILTACVDQARSNITLTGLDGAPGIAAENVRAIRVPYRREDRQRFAAVTKPSLLFSVARTTDIPAPAGDNCRYVAFYTVLAQIIHTEMMLDVTPITKSVLMWEYNIHNYFHMGNLRQAADDTVNNNWRVTLSPVQKVDITDEKLFHIFDDAVSVIPIVFKSNEFHNASGRT